VKPNYQYQKRARELAKKQKKEEKLKRRQEKAAKGKTEEDIETTGGEPAEGDLPATPPEV